MANITITSSTNAISVDFGVYATMFETKKQTWRKNAISNFRLNYNESKIFAQILYEKEWMVSYDGSAGTLQIDSINGVAPSSNSDLYDKLIALIA